MHFFHSKSKLLCLVLLTGLFFLVLDIQDDCCGDLGPMASHSCCVQCCPSHNLGPVTQGSIKMSDPGHLAVGLSREDASRYQDPFLDALYRPPIA